MDGVSNEGLASTNGRTALGHRSVRADQHDDQPGADSRAGRHLRSAEARHAYACRPPRTGTTAQGRPGRDRPPLRVRRDVCEIPVLIIDQDEQRFGQAPEPRLRGGWGKPKMPDTVPNPNPPNPCHRPQCLITVKGVTFCDVGRNCPN